MASWTEDPIEEESDEVYEESQEDEDLDTLL